MSQHDYIIADASGSAFLADLNLAVKALAENNYGTTEPAVMYAHMWWADTTNDILKKRNAANTGWISYLTLSTGAPLVTSGTWSGNATTATTSTNAVNATGSAVVTGSIGYIAGSGGMVAQGTSKTTAVTLNKICGQVNTFNDSLAAGATVTFTVNNTLFDSDDIVVINNVGGVVSNPKYSIRAGSQTGGSGAFFISIKNETGGALSESIGINFAIIKSVIA